MSRELLLNPVVIHRSDMESVMIEAAVNSVTHPVERPMSAPLLVPPPYHEPLEWS